MPRAFLASRSTNIPPRRRAVAGLALAGSHVARQPTGGRTAETLLRLLLRQRRRAARDADQPDYQDWHWFPHTDGADYRLTKSLEPLAPHRRDMTIFGGLSHPTSRLLVGHNTVDVWLTGADIRVNLQNSISIDQAIARRYGAQTRIPSLVLSSQGGVGTKSRSTTISFDAQGRAIPAESVPRRIFERLFEPPAERRPGRAGAGPGLGPPPRRFPAGRLALAAQQPRPARPATARRIPAIAQRGRKPARSAPRNGSARRCRRSIVERSTSTSRRADRPTTSAPCST